MNLSREKVATPLLQLTRTSCAGASETKFGSAQASGPINPTDPENDPAQPNAAQQD